MTGGSLGGNFTIESSDNSEKKASKDCLFGGEGIFWGRTTPPVIQLGEKGRHEVF